MTLHILCKTLINIKFSFWDTHCSQYGKIFMEFHLKKLFKYNYVTLSKKYY